MNKRTVCSVLTTLFVVIFTLTAPFYAEAESSAYIPELLDGSLPDEYYQACEESGAVYSFSYTVPLLNGGEGPAKIARVYVPYGYDQDDVSIHYNMLLLLHGRDEDSSSWIDAAHDSGERVFQMKTIYDRMIANHDCDPFLVVTIDTWFWDGWRHVDYSYEQLASEIRNVVLPYVAKHFRTYAEDGSLGSLQAARSHIGIGGNSNGSCFALHCGIVYNYDIVGNYMCFSGNNCTKEATRTISAEDNNVPAPTCFYTACGKWDTQWTNTQHGYASLEKNLPEIEDGVNGFFHDSYGGHEWHVWATELFNAMHFMFQDPSL